jgi:YD repeat-containing protein
LTAIISSNTFGLNYSSVELMPRSVDLGAGFTSRTGQVATVNAGTGNLVVSAIDQWLEALGPDSKVTRTYNSLGSFIDGDNNDQWMMGFSRRLQITANVPSARIADDGALASFSWDAGLSAYVSHSGPNANEIIKQDGSNWKWTSSDRLTSEVYSSVGKLLRISDANSNVTNFVYDSGTGRISEISAPNNRKIQIVYSGTLLGSLEVFNQGVSEAKTSYFYDSQNRLDRVSVSLPNSKVFETTFTYYGTTKQLSSVSQTDGYKLDIEYDVNGKVKKLTENAQSGPRITNYAYAGNVTTITDSLNVDTKITFDASNRISKIERAVGQAESATSAFTYNSTNFNLETFTDADGKVTRFEYDLAGNLTLEQDSLGNTVRRDYSASNQLTLLERFTGPDGSPNNGSMNAIDAQRDYKFYDANLRLTHTLSATGEVAAYYYLANGNLEYSLRFAENRFASASTAYATLQSELASWVSSANKIGAQRVNYSYNLHGQLTASESISQLLANGTADLTAVARNVKVNYVYNARGQLISTIDETRTQELQFQDTPWAKQYRVLLGKSELASGLSPADRTYLNLVLQTTYEYDGLGREIRRSSHEGISSSTYDDANKKITLTTAYGNSSVTVYDARGLIISAHQVSNAGAPLAASTFSYDTEGRLRVETDPLGNKTLHGYDKRGRKVYVVDASRKMTEFKYDVVGRMIEQKIYANPVAVDRLNAALSSPTSTAGDITQLRPVLDNGDDQVTTNRYDAAGRLRFVIDAELAVREFKYDGLTRQTQSIAYFNKVTDRSTNPVADTAQRDRINRFIYDREDRLILSVDPESYVVHHTYDAAGRKVKETRFATRAANANGDSLSGLNVAASVNDQSTYWFYDGSGRLVAEVDAERYVTSYLYNSGNQQIQKTRHATALSEAAVSALNIGAATTGTVSETRTASLLRLVNGAPNTNIVPERVEAAHYLVLSGETWASVVQKLYGVASADVVNVGLPRFHGQF